MSFYLLGICCILDDDKNVFFFILVNSTHYLFMTAFLKEKLNGKCEMQMAMKIHILIQVPCKKAKQK